MDADNKKYLICLISFMLVMGTIPIAYGATEDSLLITFDPDGDVDIDVNLSNYSFGGVLSGVWSNTTGSVFLLYNNGTVAMDTQIKSNATTDEGNMTLNETGEPYELDNFTLYTDGFDADAYITTTYGANFDDDLDVGASKGFDLCLYIGNLSANHSQQTTTIYFQGTQQ